MNLLKRLGCCTAAVCAIALLVMPVQARNRRGDKFLKEGKKAESQKEYDRALDFYDKAVATDPQEPEYLMADRRARGEASQQHLALGRELLKQQKLEDALVQFQRAFVADPGSQIALQEMEQTTAMVHEQRTAAAGTIILTPAEKARLEVEKRIDSLEGPPTLKPLNAQIPFLKMNNQPARVLYESVGKLAGINVLFDPQGIETPGAMGGGTHNFNLDLSNVSLEDALNYVALITHTFWKPISSNAIFVTQDTETKRLEYQDEVAKVFYIQNASTPAEFSEMFNAVRTASKLNTGLFSVPSEYAIVARGSPDTIALIEKLVHDLDRPKPEVLVDVIIMSVNRNKTSTIGAALLGQGGLSVPLQFAPRNPISTTGTTTTGTTTTGTTTTGTTTTGTTTGITTGTTTGITTGTSTGTTTGTTTGSTSSSPFITLPQLGHLSSADYAVSLPSTLVQALMSDTSTRILQRPQVRAIDGGQGSLKIGEQIPYVSGSLNTAVSTAIPYATTQFQQVQIGTEIDFKPHVNGPNDISMHIKVSLTNLAGQVNIAGIDEPEIGNQVDEADIRMKDGEVSLLGGLSDIESSMSLSGFPGLTNMPLLDYIFGAKQKTNINNEILIALVPHVIRAPISDYTVTAQQGVYAGTDRVVHVIRGPSGTPLTPAPTPAIPPTVPPKTSTPLAPTPNPPSQPKPIK